MARLPDKVIKLFLIWATSNQPGEADNAKRMLEQELKKDGLDMHTLAERLQNEGQYTEHEMVEAYRRGRDEERQNMVAVSAAPAQTDWHRIAKLCLANKRCFAATENWNLSRAWF